MEYFQFGDTVVIDDGSDNLELLDYLFSLQRRGIGVIHRPRWPAPGFYVMPHGGLYENMDAAIDFAMSHGYDYVNFIQDDVQFMWHSPNLLSEIERIFHTLPNACQVGNIFDKAILKDARKPRFQPVPQADCYHITFHAMADIGIIPVALIKELGFHFGNGVESSNSLWWYRRGYKRYCLKSPTMAWVPWPEVMQQDLRVSNGRMPVERYYLKPLEDHQIKKLLERPLEDIPFTEDYCFPWGWDCPTPYWFSRGKSRPKWAKPARQLARQLVPKRLKAPLSNALRSLISE